MGRDCNSHVCDEPIAKPAYDELADTYVEEVRSNPYNAHLEFSATSALIPKVECKRILDAGCGTGRYTEWLLERGADVVGFDASEEMLIHAVTGSVMRLTSTGQLSRNHSGLLARLRLTVSSVHSRLDTCRTSGNRFLNSHVY